MPDIVNEFSDALLAIDRLSVKQIFTDSRRQMSATAFVEDVVVDALEKIGAGWENGTIALSQIYMSGRICEELVDELLPPGDPNRKEQPKAAITVLNDYHMMGKRIVYSLLRAGGFELLDYGRSDVDALLHRVEADGVEILLISTLMLPSALLVKAVKEKLADAGLPVKIIVGGAPFRFDDQLWREVGADAMCRTASEAVSVITEVAGGIS